MASIAASESETKYFSRTAECLKPNVLWTSLELFIYLALGHCSTALRGLVPDSTRKLNCGHNHPEPSHDYINRLKKYCAQRKQYSAFMREIGKPRRVEWVE